MKKTDTYQLNQWELSDRIRMEDFNADNLRLESILGKKLGRFQKLGEHASGEGKNTAGVPTFFLDWSPWECIVAYYDLHKTAFLPGDTIAVAPIYSDNSVGDFFGDLGGGSFFILLFPFHNKDAAVRGFLAGKGSAPVFADRPFSDLTGFSLRLKNASCGNMLDLSNTTFTSPLWSVYGLR